ncbi:MAG: metallopeptidase family protein [Candidatus Pacebacteria bacterium]|jgi:predicted Zn-dependent protease with MMP-like domain|nr:metallopeptidase family protein [Candidatus Paceibacterota bacterium]
MDKTFKKCEDLKMKEEEFEKLVAEALDELPKAIQEKMDNIEVTVERGSVRGPYLGLYEGVPQNAWGRGFGMVLPDKITIFQLPMESMARSRDELKEIIKDTVWHEIAHHFGFDEKKVRELEKKRRNRRN